MGIGELKEGEKETIPQPETKKQANHIGVEKEEKEGEDK